MNVAMVLVFCFASWLLSSPAYLQDEIPSSIKVSDPVLRKELLDCVERDQAIRKELIKAGVVNPDKSLLERMKAIDERNTNRIKEVIREIGWPSIERVGNDGVNAAFLLVQHSDLATQREMLPLIEKAYKNEQVSGQNYALLVDRVLVGEGKPQIYGTQALPFEQWSNQEPVFAPIHEIENVDQRRRSVGLSTLAEYRKLLRQVYFPKQ